MAKKEIIINGIRIPYTQDIKIESVQNFHVGALNSGKNFYRNMRDKSRVITFKSIVPTKYPDKSKELGDLFNNLRVKTQSAPVPIVVDDSLRFNGVITELDLDIPFDLFVHRYEWTIEEADTFNTTTKEFKTFNYVDPVKPDPKPPKDNTPQWIKDLYKCNMSYNCNKKKVKCVYYLQDLLRQDGYYKKNPTSGRAYVRDGLWCKWTSEEYKKWQKKKAKVKVTNKWDSASKAYLKKRYNLK